VALLAPTIAAAQGAGDGFLFRRPVGSFTLRGGFAQAMARSDVFDDATTFLTLDRRDFSSLAFGGDLAFSLSPRIDVSFGATYAGTSQPSRFRDYVDSDDAEIYQNTAFRRLPVTATLKAYLAPRGRSIGRFAWIPSRVAPYVGAGGGAMWYRLRQTGDFVDFEDLSIFADELESSGWTPTAHGLAGLEYSLGPRFYLVGETRYDWAKARLQSDFTGFDRIDLSGVSATLGVAVRF
jgi:hypothetical protein